MLASTVGTTPQELHCLKLCSKKNHESSPYASCDYKTSKHYNHNQCIFSSSPFNMSFQGSIVLHLLVLAPVWCQVENYADTIPGVAGQDYPIFAFPPATSFVCDGRSRGYYSDPEADCQAFTICAENGEDGGVGLLKFSFLCPNGTVFNQESFVCDWWFNVDCSVAEQFYGLNQQVFTDEEED